MLWVSELSQKSHWLLWFSSSSANSKVLNIRDVTLKLYVYKHNYAVYIKLAWLVYHKSNPTNDRMYLTAWLCTASLTCEFRIIWHSYHTWTGSSSTLTCPAISIISRARWQIDLAWCVHGSGRPLTVMYLSPTVSTCEAKHFVILPMEDIIICFDQCFTFISSKIMCSYCATTRLLECAVPLEINWNTPR